MKPKEELIHSLYKIIYQGTKNLEVGLEILYIFQKAESDLFLQRMKKAYETNRTPFSSYLSHVENSDDFLAAFYQPENDPLLNDFIIGEIKSERIKNYLVNQENNRLLALSTVKDIFTEEPFETMETLSISGDIFTKSQQILREVNYQRSFIFLRKHFIYLFQDQLNHESLAAWISTFTLLKNQNIASIETFLQENHPSPFQDLITHVRGDVNIDNLLSFLYSFWPLAFATPDEFFAYTTRTIGIYVKKLDNLETIRFLSKMRQADISSLLKDPHSFLKNQGETSYESLHFHKIFLNISEEEQEQSALLITSFITHYSSRALPLILKYKTSHTWRDYSQALNYSHKEDFLEEKAIEESFTYKLKIKEFWQSFEEILNFQPFESLKGLSEPNLLLFPNLISNHLAEGRKTWGSSWFGFYVKVAGDPQAPAFQEFLRYFKTLSRPVQSHKIIYYLSSISLPEYNHFLFIFQLLAYLNVANHPSDPFTLIEDEEERTLLFELSRKSLSVDWLNSSIIIHSLESRQTLLEYLINKTKGFSLSDLEFFDPYSPVLFWLLLKSQAIIENSIVIHPQREQFLLYLKYWKEHSD